MSDMEIISNEDYGKMVSQQRRVALIVQKEKERLQSKKENIDEQEQNAKRMIMLNRSYRDKQKAYLILMTLFLVILGGCLLVIFLQERMGYTNALMDWLLIFIVGVGLISAYYIYVNILSRDNINFSKLSDKHLLSPSEFKNSYQDELEKGDLSAVTTKLCEGPSCCGPGFTYSETNNICE